MDSRHLKRHGLLAQLKEIDGACDAVELLDADGELVLKNGDDPWEPSARCSQAGSRAVWSLAGAPKRQTAWKKGPFCFCKVKLIALKTC